MARTENDRITVVSTLDGRMIEADSIDAERASRIALMGAIMYGSLKSVLPSQNAKTGSIRASLSGTLLQVKKEDDRLFIEIYDGKSDIRSHLEKP